MIRLGRLSMLLLAVAVPAGALAVDAPHVTTESCQACHVGHNAPAGALTKDALGVTNLCNSCHAASSTNFGFPWVSGPNTEEAQPGTRGTSHSWSGEATNALRGAVAPSASSGDPVEAAMGGHLAGTALKCTTCHDAHQSDVYGGTLHTSVPLNTNIGHTVGTQTTLQLVSVGTGARSASYTIKISGTNQFKISHDKGLTYFGYNGSSWAPDSTAGYTNGKATGANVTLDDEITRVTFGGTVTTGDVFADFYVSYPFLRADNAGGRMCVTCHKERDMRWQDVEGGDANGIAGGVKTVTLGTTVFSHPVGQPLAKSYDRSEAAILDADGGAQSPGDGNPTNDLRLTGGNVTCLSCHGAHNADSNSLSTDPH